MMRRWLSDKHVMLQVEPRDYVDFNWMQPRLLQEPESHPRTLRKFTELAWMKDLTLVRATVKTLEADKAELSNGDQVPFDYCIICCGALPATQAQAYAPAECPMHIGFVSCVTQLAGACTSRLACTQRSQ